MSAEVPGTVEVNECVVRSTRIVEPRLVLPEVGFSGAA